MRAGVRGINVKLVKCGGLYPALQVSHVARACGLRVMPGRMIESSVMITAAAHLAPLADYAGPNGAVLKSVRPL